MVGLAEQFSCEFPLTQADLADLFSLSVVHVNRSIQELRRLGLLSVGSRRMTIHDMRALRELSMFDPAYAAVHGKVVSEPGANGNVGRQIPRNTP